MYTYWATVAAVHDGDTVSFFVDLGFNVFLHPVNEKSRERMSFRLFGCNARELAQPGGPEARDHLAELLPVGLTVELASVKRDKYGGRYDAVVTMPDGTDLRDTLIADGWAVPWDGTGPKPIPPWPRPS